MSVSCAYRFEPLLTNLSERWDDLNEFEWSMRRVKVENIAVKGACKGRVVETYFKHNRVTVLDFRENQL